MLTPTCSINWSRTNIPPCCTSRRRESIVTMTLAFCRRNVPIEGWRDYNTGSTGGQRLAVFRCTLSSTQPHLMFRAWRSAGRTPGVSRADSFDTLPRHPLPLSLLYPIWESVSLRSERAEGRGEGRADLAAGCEGECGETLRLTRTAREQVKTFPVCALARSTAFGFQAEVVLSPHSRARPL